MLEKLPLLAPALVLSAAAMTIACEGVVAVSTGPALIQPATLSIDPSPLAPEEITWGCGGRPGFGLRFRLHASSREDIFLRKVRFEFTDFFGKRWMPTVSLLASTFHGQGGGVGATTSGAPVPTPGTIIPMPGYAALHPALMVTTSVQLVPFFLEFECGAHRSGTLVVIGDFDRRGEVHSFNVSARVGQ